MAPQASKRVETSGKAFPEPPEPLGPQKFGFRRRGREKRAFRITSNPVKLARRRRKAPESSPKVALTQGRGNPSAGQHSLPGVLQARDRIQVSKRGDSVEWSEERAFQTVDSIVVKCGGRRFSRDLLDLLYTTIYIMGERGLGNASGLRSTLSLLLKCARF